METINVGELTVFLDSQPVIKGAAWASMMKPGLWLGTLLDGQIDIHTTGGGGGLWARGTTGVFWSEHATESNHTALTDGRLSGVFVHVPLDAVDAVLMPTDLDLLCRTSSNAHASDAAVLGPIARQMLGSRLDGPARRLQIGGKALEMLAHVLDRSDAKEGNAAIHLRRVWRPRDVERFHEARRILLMELQTPPSISELARRLGISVRTLGAGFIDHFGQSPYAFLKEQRLQTAHRLLEAGESSISGVAYELGYHPNHFTTEFRRRFGYPPGRIRKKR